MHSFTARRRLPWALVGVLALQALWMGWLWSYGFPRLTSDAICFKQPAYMRLHSPHFSVPTYAGQAPGIEKFNSYPAQVYYYANYLVFRLFGFGHATSLAFDLGVHLAIVLIAAWGLWRATGDQLPGIVFALGSSQWLLAVGRPEELGMLWVLVGLLAVERGRGGLAAAIVMLGLAGATSPGSAVVGTVLVLAYDGFRRNFDRSYWPRAAALAIVPMLIAGTIYIGSVWPDLSEALEQSAALFENGFYVKKSLLRISRESPPWALSTLPLSAAGLAVGLYCLLRRPAWFDRSSPAGALVAAATLAIVAGYALNIVGQRLRYDFRHVSALSLANVSLAIGWWAARSPRPLLAPLAAAAVVLAFALPVQRDLLRYTLAPLAWEDDAIDFAQAARTVNEVVPPTATVGGDASVWTMITDGRPFLATRGITPEFWPDYLISSTWTALPSALRQDHDSLKLASEYEEVTPQPVLPQEGGGLRVLGHYIPLAMGRCDWYVRIWKRRSAPPPGDESSAAAPR